MNIIFCVLLVAHAVLAEDTNQKINLEDIERDNLISERRSQNKEVLEGQHTQHLRPPSIHASTNYEIRHETDDVTTNDITYSHQAPTENQYESHQQNNVQYVTLQPQSPQYQDEKEYESQPQSPPSQYRPVHEEGRTYSAPSRHSLVSPIIPTASATPSPYLAQQPQYVYVQAGQSPTQQSSNNYDQKTQDGVRYAQGISYAQQQESVDTNYEQASQSEPEQPENGGITYVHQTPEGAAYSTQPQQYIQYVPYASQGPDQQTFIMMVPLRNAHAYAHSRPSVPSVRYTQQTTYSVQKPQPIPTVTYTHSGPAEENTQLHAPQSTIAPATSSQLHYSVPSYSYQHSVQPTHSIQYAPQHLTQPTHSIQYTPQHSVQPTHSIQYASQHSVQPTHSIQYTPQHSVQPTHSIQYASQHSVQPTHSIQYTPQQVQIQQSVEYPSRHEYYHAPKVVSLHSAPHYQSHFQPSYQYGSPQLDFFGAYNKQHSSLIDSYIPSSVILDRQRTFLQKNQVYQPASPITNHASAVNTHSLNGYNTIAYSTPLGYSYNHLKRSPSLPVSTKLQPKAQKATKLTKVSTKA